MPPLSAAAVCFPFADNLWKARLMNFLPVADLTLVRSGYNSGYFPPLLWPKQTLDASWEKSIETTDSLETESDHRDRDLFRTGPQSYRRVAWNRKS